MDTQLGPRHEAQTGHSHMTFSKSLSCDFRHIKKVMKVGLAPHRADTAVCARPGGTVNV